MKKNRGKLDEDLLGFVFDNYATHAQAGIKINEIYTIHIAR